VEMFDLLASNPVPDCLCVRAHRGVLKLIAQKDGDEFSLGGELSGSVIR
jgi:hypothetical protein